MSATKESASTPGQYNNPLQVILEAQLASLEAQIAAIRMILSLKRETEQEMESAAEAVDSVAKAMGSEPVVDEEGFVQPAVFGASR